MNFNKVIVGGNMTRDPVLRYTPSQTAVVDFGIAVNRKFGEGKEETTFVDCVAFNKLAENISKFFRKGRPILIEGRIRTDSWEKDGQKRSRNIVVIDGFEFCDSKQADDNGGGQSPNEELPESNENIPF
ncbi:MAG: single-stranded DNA-binding protein [Balneolaceae bacterium]